MHINASDSESRTRSTMSQVSVPTELLYGFIEEVWESTLTPEERTGFMIVSTLVSKGWSSMFEKIFSINMHILCESFYHKVFADDATRDYSKCKRLTFTVSDTNCAHSTKHWSARSIRTLSYMRHDDITKFTSLNTIQIVYHNSTFPDPYVQGFFSAIPDGLPNLVISYTFSPDISSCSIQRHRRHFKRESKIRYAEPHIGTLVVNGADEYVAATWESLFPTRERLIRDGRQEAGPLLGVTSLFVPDQALLVRLKDAQRQHDDRQRANITGKPGSVDVIAIEADGTTFISSNNAIASSPPRFPPSTFVGELGYVDTSSETFVPLFNTFEPLILDATSTIPSLYGYGSAKIQMKSVKAEPVPWRNHYEEGKANWVKKLMSLLKVQEKSLKYIDSSKSGAAVNWFEQNVDRIVGVYGKQYGVAAEDIVLITGITVS